MKNLEAGVQELFDKLVEKGWGIHIFTHIFEGQKEVRLHRVSDIYYNRLFIKSFFCLHSVNFLVPFQNELHT